MTTTQETPETAQPTTSDWHWIMTVQTAGGVVNTRTAVITVPAGFTRANAFDFVFNQFKKDHGAPLTVVFFDLQPNQM